MIAAGQGKPRPAAIAVSSRPTLALLLGLVLRLMRELAHTVRRLSVLLATVSGSVAETAPIRSLRW